MTTEQFLKELATLSKPGKSYKPHKHLALLAVVQLIRKGVLRTPRIPFDEAFRSAFSALHKQYGGDADRDRPYTPFFHLSRHAFWKLLAQTGQESALAAAETVGSSGDLVRLVSCAELDQAVFDSLIDPIANRKVEQQIESLIQEGIESRSEDAASDDAVSSGSLFAHEDAALRVIRAHVESHKLGLVLSNLEIHDPQSNRYFEVDLAVVSLFGVYVGELKHWSGRVEIRPNSWLQNGSFYKPDPHKANNFKAKLLKGLYERHFPHFPPVYFESVVVFTNPDVSVDGASVPKTASHNPTFESISRFLEYLKKQRESGPSRLTGAQCQAFAEYVRKLHHPGRPRDFVFPGYEIVERLYQHVDRAEVVARRTDLRHRRLSRLRIFFSPVGATKAEAAVAHERATATLNAVAKIGDHPNVLKVWSVPNENNYLVEGSDWSETGTLRDVLEREGALGAERAARIAAGLTRGLHAVHEQCVVHRALSPENVLMVDDTPKLMNFDLAFQLEDNRVTVIPDVAKLKRVPYIAPEIYAGGRVPESTADLFSVGVILYEMLTGSRPFGCSTDLERTGGCLTSAHRQELDKHQVPANLIELVIEIVQRDPAGRPRDALEVAKRLDAGEAAPAAVREANPLLSQGEQSGLYAIEAYLGAGAESQMYRAIGARGRPVALKLFGCDVPLQRVVDEQRFAAAVHHPSIVRVDSYSQWKDGRYYIAFGWVSGKSLRDEIACGVRPDAERFYRIAEQLLDALAALHQNTEDGAATPILHNDIKPDNVLLADGDRPVLVDFGAASAPHVGTYQGSEGYVAPDLRLGQDRKYCEDGDLYGLAVTLDEWLAASRPGDEERAAVVPASIFEWLKKGRASEAVQRFASATEMRRALQATLKPKEPGLAPGADERSAAAEEIPAAPPQEPERLTALRPMHGDPNPFVTYLNTLHSRNAETDSALAESQACNPFFSFIHVPHPLVGEVEEILLGQARRHVVVTGHAGDGKSTIAVELLKRLTGLPADLPVPAPLKRREDVNTPSHCISLIKDFNEWSRDERAGVLTEMLDPAGKRFFLISNTGTLLDAFKSHEQGGDWMRIESDLLTAMNDPGPNEVSFHDASFAVVNIAMCDNLGIAREIFGRMLAAGRWQACGAAECRSRCPIYRNVSLIQANRETVMQRLFLAYRRMYEYGTRLTLRQLCQHMAYMLTSGLSHGDVVTMSQSASPPLMSEFMFFNRFFGDNGKEPDGPASQIRAVRAVREQEFGVPLCPTWERRLWLRSRGRTFELDAAAPPDDFDLLRRIGAGLPLDDAITAAQAREQVRRAVFFLHRFDERDDGSFLKTFLRSAMLLDFDRWQNQAGETLGLQETTLLHRRIMHVLQEHFTGVRLPEGTASDRHLFVTLSRRSHDIRQSAQVVLARYPEEDFKVRLQSENNGVGGIRRRLVLDGTGRFDDLLLPLALPFLDYVMMRNQGEVGKDLQACYVDRLERFKGQLIRRSPSKRGDDIMLVRLRTNHTFRRQIFAVRDNHLEVTDG